MLDKLSTLTPQNAREHGKMLEKVSDLFADESPESHAVLVGALSVNYIIMKNCVIIARYHLGKYDGQLGIDETIKDFWPLNLSDNLFNLATEKCKILPHSDHYKQQQEQMARGIIKGFELVTDLSDDERQNIVTALSQIAIENVVSADEKEAIELSIAAIQFIQKFNTNS